MPTEVHLQLVAESAIIAGNWAWKYPPKTSMLPRICGYGNVGSDLRSLIDH